MLYALKVYLEVYVGFIQERPLTVGDPLPDVKSSNKFVYVCLVNFEKAGCLFLVFSYSSGS